MDTLDSDHVFLEDNATSELNSAKKKKSSNQNIPVLGETFILMKSKLIWGCVCAAATV